MGEDMETLVEADGINVEICWGAACGGACWEADDCDCWTLALESIELAVSVVVDEATAGMTVEGANGPVGVGGHSLNECTKNEWWYA